MCVCMYTFGVLHEKAQMAKFVFVEDFLSLSLFSFLFHFYSLFFLPPPLQGLRSGLRVLSLSESRPFFSSALLSRATFSLYFFFSSIQFKMPF